MPAFFLLWAALGSAVPEANPTTELFDGKSLQGWKAADFYRAGEFPPRVEGGTIVLPAGQPMTGIVSNRPDLPTANYELSYEAKRLAGADFFAAATFPVGKSFLTFVNGGWGGNVTGLSSLSGMDASENETNRFVKYRDDTWYRFQVRVTERVVRCRIDDKEVLAVDLEGHQVATRIESRACQPLGFAAWKTAGALRAIRLRPLTPAEIAAHDKVN